MRTAFLAFAIALLLPGVAAAQVTVGQGAKPSVAVDAAGTAYIVWYGPQNQSALHFCRLPRGATACAGAPTIVAGGASTGTSLSRPFVSVAGSQLRVVQFRYGYSSGAFNRVMLFTSSDGGSSWDAGVSIGSASPDAFDEALFGPGGAISAIANNAGTLQSLPLQAGVGPEPTALFPGHLYNGGLTDTGGGIVAVSADASSNAVFRVHGSGAFTDPASWSAPAALGYADYPRLAGPFLLAGDAARNMYVRRWTGLGFGAPVSLGPGDASESHVFVDAAGRVHAVYPRLDAEGYHLQYAVSGDGVNWSSRSLLVQPFAEQGALRIAAAPDGVGVAVWSADGQIRVTPVGPAPAPPPPAPPEAPPAPTPAPTPAFGESVVVRPVRGTVRVRLRGSNRFVDLAALGAVPVGATLDTKRGVVELTAQQRGGAVQRIRLNGGWFRVSQTRTTTDFTLNEPLARCRARAAAQRKSRPRTRKLWGNGRGKFRTRGQYSAATIRGTRYLVRDSCAGTLTRVTKGRVVVRHGRRSIVVRAGKSYLARPRR